MDIIEKVEQVRKQTVETFGGNPYLIIHVDLDKTLTMDTCWTEEDCLNARPNKRMVEVVKRLSRRDVVIIYTARHDGLFGASNIWLKKQGIRCPLSNNKEPTSLYIDDKSFNPFENGNTVLKNKQYRVWY